MTAADFTRQTGGAACPEVPAEQPPPADMPPVRLMILDSLADDAETVYTMRNCGEMAPNGVALVGESHLLGAIRSLLDGGLVEVKLEHVVIGERLFVRRLAERASTSDDDLRRYWFEMTPAGQATWRQASDVLDAYRAAHPVEPGDDSTDSQ